MTRQWSLDKNFILHLFKQFSFDSRIWLQWICELKYTTNIGVQNLCLFREQYGWLLKIEETYKLSFWSKKMAEPRVLKLQSPAYGEPIYYKWPLVNTVRHLCFYISTKRCSPRKRLYILYQWYTNFLFTPKTVSSSEGRRSAYAGFMQYDVKLWEKICN